MASGLADHVWSLGELLSYKVAFAPWIAPRRRGRPPKQTKLSAEQQHASSRVGPLLRLRQGVLYPTTV